MFQCMKLLSKTANKSYDNHNFIVNANETKYFQLNFLMHLVQQEHLQLQISSTITHLNQLIKELFTKIHLHNSEVSLKVLHSSEVDRFHRSPF